MSTHHEVRTLVPSDFSALMALEQQLFADDPYGTLGPYYLRLCCEFYREDCFLALSGGQPAAYLLSFVKGREAYCTTLGVLPQYQGTRLVPKLLRAFVASMVNRVDSCVFTTTEDNRAARTLHAHLGAREVGLREDFYGPGDRRIVSRIDRDAFDALRAKYSRLGLVNSEPTAATAPDSGVHASALQVA